MRLARFRTPSGEARIGVAVTLGEGEALLDLAAAAAAFETRLPDRMTGLIMEGRAGLDHLSRLVARAACEGRTEWFHPVETIRWLVPLEVRSCLAAGRNFRTHLEESVRGAPERAIGLHADFPTGFSKLPQAIVPHRARVARPADVTQMDYEIELAAVVGEVVADASPSQAAEAVFGYTILNDISAREWQLREMANRLLLLGKNFPGFGPMGPYILTADEVPDPSTLRLRLTVNGETRQDGLCSDMIFSVAELVSFWSKAGLGPGDVIATGTPEGVALHHKPDPSPFFLKPGDIVHATIDGIGTLETRIVEAAPMA
jgi:2-keto-4-pentenoate hydratase/2-oxohepta-3-ene-1,7-dioic acid hydratase in catechol pathway